MNGPPNRRSQTTHRPPNDTGEKAVREYEDPGQRTLLVALAIAFVLSALVARGPLGQRPALAVFLRLKLLVSTFNLVLLVALTWTYASLYRDLPNPFTRSLILVTTALFSYALTSNPLVHVLLGFSLRGVVAGLGPFTVLPDVFASVAVVAFLYQSYK